MEVAVARNNRTQNWWPGRMLLIIALSFSLLLMACGGGESTPNTDGDEDTWPEFDVTDEDPDFDPNAPAMIETTPGDEIKFGTALIGSHVDVEVYVRNTGQGTLNITSMNIIANTDEFSVLGVDLENFEAFSLAPNADRILTVRYEPEDGGIDSGVLQIVSNASNTPLKALNLVSEYKGESELRFYRPCSQAELGDPYDSTCYNNSMAWKHILPQETTELLIYSLGNAAVGDFLNGTLKVCNVLDDATDVNKAIRVTSAVMSPPSAIFTLTPNKDPKPSDPVYLSPASEPGSLNCMDVMVEYNPDQPTYPPETHHVELVVQHDADHPAESPQRVVIEGTASDTALVVYPNPIEFGTVEYFHPSTIQVSITNPSSAAIQISGPSGQDGIDVQNADGSEMFTVTFPGLGPFPWTVAGGETIDVEVTFDPTDNRYREDYLRIFTNIPGADTVRIKMTGTGKPTNLEPTARIARTDSGPDITQPIVSEVCTGTNCDTLYFFGDISYDPDRTDWNSNGVKEYHWTFVKPDSSHMELWPMNYDSPPFNTGVVNFASGIDKPGEYTIGLIVVDHDLAESYEKTVWIRTYGSDSISMSLDFSCNGRMDVDLQWLAPNGMVCSPEFMNASRTCDFGAYGNAIVTEYTEGCKVGHTEAITHEDAPDGTYRIKAKFVEDCNWDLPLNIPLVDCVATGDTDLTLKIYINGELSWTRTGHMDEKGDEVEWTIDRVNGSFYEPSP